MQYPTPRVDGNELWVIGVVVTLLVTAGIVIHLL